MTKVFVKNIPNDAIASDIADALSQFGPIHTVDIIPNRRRNQTTRFGFAEFMEQEDANDCIALANEFPPDCMGTSLCILPYTGNRKKSEANEVNEATFPLSNIEIGNWGGQLSVTQERRNRRDVPEKFTFLT